MGRDVPIVAYLADHKTRMVRSDTGTPELRKYAAEALERYRGANDKVEGIKRYVRQVEKGEEKELSHKGGRYPSKAQWALRQFSKTRKIKMKDGKFSRVTVQNGGDVRQLDPSQF